MHGYHLDRRSAPAPGAESLQSLSEVLRLVDQH